MARYNAFLSYAREDAPAVQRFRDRLDHEKIPYWIDTSQLQGGEEWETSIVEALRKSDCLVVFVTKNMFGSSVEKEIDIAAAEDKAIIPVALDGAIDEDNATAGGIISSIDAAATSSKA